MQFQVLVRKRGQLFAKWVHAVRSICHLLRVMRFLGYEEWYLAGFYIDGKYWDVL